jgi:hypothetical protein
MKEGKTLVVIGLYTLFLLSPFLTLQTSVQDKT